MPRSRGMTGGPDPSTEDHKAVGFLSNTSPDPLENHEDTKSAFNVEPSSPADDSPLPISGIWTHSPTKKQLVDPSDKTFWICASFVAHMRKSKEKLPSASVTRQVKNQPDKPQRLA